MDYKKEDLTLKTFLIVDFNYATGVHFKDRSIGEFLSYLEEPGKFIKDEKGEWHNKEHILRFRRREYSEERNEHYGTPIHDEIVQ